jgi:catechol 2,3-dioxygenase-like lactoylglutathione lyase family enzyme
MIRHLGGIAEIVEDVPAALAFYRDTLGFEVVQQMEDDYAVVAVPGVLHFGIWSRSHAALSTFGSRDAVDRIPLGYTIEFEVDDIDSAAKQIEGGGLKVVQQPHLEPWGQKSSRAIAPGGGILGLAETPWARQLKQQPIAGDGHA